MVFSEDVFYGTSEGNLVLYLNNCIYIYFKNGVDGSFSAFD